MENNICKVFIIHISWKKGKLKRKYDQTTQLYYLHSVHYKCQAAFTWFLLLYCLLPSLYTVILPTCVTESIKLQGGWLSVDFVSSRNYSWKLLCWNGTCFVYRRFTFNFLRSYVQFCCIFRYEKVKYCYLKTLIRKYNSFDKNESVTIYFFNILINSDCYFFKRLIV